ncbi:MAG: hypothetical protein IKP22_02540 [Clostridia bacterium]|nr:hypothetical protein [Clostridia bacterium]
MKRKFFCLIAAFAMLLALPVSADNNASLPDLGTYDPEVIKSLTWKTGTHFYDYVLFNYDNTNDPFESYEITAVLPDMSPALVLRDGSRTVTVEPYIQASYGIAVPFLFFSVSDTTVRISRVEIRTGQITLSCDFSGAEEHLAVDQQNRSSAAYVVNIGSNLFTLIGDLADNGAVLSCTVTLEDGTTLEASSENIPEEKNNPFYWLDLCLKRSHLLDNDRRLQESLRLYTAQYILHFDTLPEVKMTGAEWQNDLDDSIAAYPIKLEYAYGVEGAAFTVGILNYAGAFGSKSIRSSSSVRLTYYCLDGDGQVLAFADGSVFRYVDSFCRLEPCESDVLPFDVPLPEGTETVMAAISSVTWSEGAVQTVPDRDLVFVKYTPQKVVPDTVTENDAFSL